MLPIAEPSFVKANRSWPPWNPLVMETVAEASVALSASAMVSAGSTGSATCSLAAVVPPDVVTVGGVFWDWSITVNEVGRPRAESSAAVYQRELPALSAILIEVTL
jgi:hypothetical protein